MRAALLLLLFASPHPADEFATSQGPVRITPLHHASLLMEGGGQAIYVDPTSDADYTGLPQADLILITDIHFDHLDPKVLPKLRKPGTVIVAPPAVVQTLREALPIANGETREVGRWRIDAIAAYNLKRGPEPGKFFHDKGRGNGYLLTFGGKRFYLSGDTEAVPEMKALKNIDVAFVCMNLPYTMPPEEAAEAVRAFKPRVVYPYHYRGSDLAAFKSALAGSGVEVRIRDWYR